MSKPNPLDYTLWDADIIAEMIGQSPRYFKEYIVPAVGFPPAIRFPNTKGGRTTPRWKASDVVQWINKHQERRAA